MLPELLFYIALTFNHFWTITRNNNIIYPIFNSYIIKIIWSSNLLFYNSLLWNKFCFTKVLLTNNNSKRNKSRICCHGILFYFMANLLNLVFYLMYRKYTKLT